KGVSIKPSKSGRADRVMAPSPWLDSGWQGAAQDTPSLDRVWPLGVGSLQVVVGGGPQARRAPERGGSPRVVDQTASPALAHGWPVGAALWLPRSLPACARGPRLSQWQQSAPFPGHAVAWLPLPMHSPAAP